MWNWEILDAEQGRGCRRPCCSPNHCLLWVGQNSRAANEGGIFKNICAAELWSFWLCQRTLQSFVCWSWMRKHDENKHTVNHFRVPTSLEYDTVVHRSPLETLRFVNKVPRFCTWTQISVFFSGNERESKCFSRLLLVILNQKGTKSVAVCTLSSISGIVQACQRRCVCVPSQSFLLGCRGWEKCWEKEKEISDGHVVLACELLMLLEWCGIRSGIGLEQLSLLQTALETGSETPGWKGS